ncbi:uncharacterized protein LOC125889190 [Epinephelus fuscoguttatus]|uniref:uncharacterized protein LOC125889190 n=1 Tax=Epinephelus fuscoguttatus TaxID=293821 RepID=UPI0020D13AFE|nr:uncharacterized protein LOC125889190 [Epinephelus fuscoguttatus]
MSQTLPTTRDAACQCDELQKATREIGCQTDCYVGRRTVATQLSKRALYNRKTTGSQATVATRRVAVGNNTSQFLPLCSSTPQKRRAGRDDGPQAKRSLLECPSLQESDVTSVSADPDDSSYLPSISSLDDTISDQSACMRVASTEEYGGVSHFWAAILRGICNCQLLSITQTHHL